MPGALILRAAREGRPWHCGSDFKYNDAMEKTKPSLIWLLLVPVLMIGGVVGAVVITIAGTMSIAEGMQRVPAGQSGTVTFDTAGETSVFIEQRGVMQASVPDGLKFTITPEAGGEPLPHTYPSGNFTYNANGVAGRNWLTVNIPSPGRYTVTTTHEGGPAPANTSIALAGNPGEKLAATLLGAFGLGGGGFVLGLVALIWILVARSRSQKRIMQARYAQMPPMPPPGYANH